jgi:succinate dehydrogenase / fumarate reductase cytochrome b subunit
VKESSGHPLWGVIASSLGSKYVMALTGLGLMGFVVVHMLGNLQLFIDPEWLNGYAQALKEKPALLWTARSILLVIFLIHVLVGIRLTQTNMDARPTRYVYQDTIQASWASRHMLLTGLVILAFIIYHLAHFTFGVVVNANWQRSPLGVEKNYLELAEVRDPGKREYDPRQTVSLSNALRKGQDARQDVYGMIVSAFRNPWIALSYIVAQIVLGMHLWHGGSSWFQSLGINHPRYNRFLRAFGPTLAVIVVVGNCSMPLAALGGLIR